MFKAISVIIILLSTAVSYSQSFHFKMGLNNEKKEKSDHAIKWYLRAEKSIDPKLKQELYLKIYGLALKLDTGAYGGRKEYLNLAVKYHQKYIKMKSVDPQIKGQQLSDLKTEVKNEIVCMTANKKRSNTLHTFYKAQSSTYEDELIVLLYDLSKIANKSEADWALFYDSYFKVFQLSNNNVSLSSKSRKFFDKIINDHLNESFLNIAPEISRKISDLEYFRMSYGLKLKKEVSELFATVEEKSQAVEFGSLLWKLWNYEKQIYRVNPDLLDKRILKISYLKQIKGVVRSQGSNGLNDYLLNQNCYSKDDICFDTDIFYYDGFEGLREKPLVMNNQLLQQVFLNVVEENLNKSKDWNTLNPIISVFKSDSAFRTINDRLLLKEHLSRNFNYYFEYAGICFEYPEFDKMLFADLLFETAKERISSTVKTKDLSSATSEFMRSVQMFPMRNWKDQKVWFYNHFKTRLNNKETALMGKEILVATHFFRDDKDFKFLINQYRDHEFRITLKNNNIKPDSWTGSTEICDCGTMSDEYMIAALESMKFYRRYAGLPDSIYFREKENRDAQCAALIMQAVNDKSKGDKTYLEHHPKTTAPCYSAEGYYGASSGNLMYGTANSGVAGTYIDDFGQGATGHRAWVLAPTLVSYGFGSTFNANCLVWGGAEKRYDLTNFYRNVPFSWPPAGEVSDDLIDNADIWTFALQGANFSKAVVKVFSDDREIPVKIAYYQDYLSGGYGNFSYLNFDLGIEEVIEKSVVRGGNFEIRYSRSKAQKGKTYEVVIENVLDWYGNTRSFRYKVQII